MILIKNKQRKYPLDIDYVRSVVECILGVLGYDDFDIGIWLTNNATIAKYNRMYRHLSGSTDILSFPYHHNIRAGQRVQARTMDQKNLGDLIISLEFIHTSKQWCGFDPQEALKILLVHGIYHLLGYDHEDEADYYVMHAKEQQLIRILNKRFSLQNGDAKGI
jgi:rRNA maturation RNase YbeY